MNKADINLISEAYVSQILTEEQRKEEIRQFVGNNWDDIKVAFKEVLPSLVAVGSVIASIVGTSAAAQAYFNRHPELYKYGPQFIEWLGQHKDLVVQWLYKHPEILEKLYEVLH